MKVLLYGLIIVGCSGIGYHTGGFYGKRCKTIDQLIYAISILNAEIAYSLTPLKRAFEKIGAYTEGGVGAFFVGCAGKMEQNQKRLEEIWNEEMTAMEEGLPILEEEIEILRCLGGSLGKNDEENQKKSIEIALTRLRATAKEAREKQKKYSGLSRSLGVMAGIFIVIMMI